MLCCRRPFSCRPGLSGQAGLDLRLDNCTFLRWTPAADAIERSRPRRRRLGMPSYEQLSRRWMVGLNSGSFYHQEQMRLRNQRLADGGEIWPASTCLLCKSAVLRRVPGTRFEPICSEITDCQNVNQLVKFTTLACQQPFQNPRSTRKN